MGTERPTAFSVATWPFAKEAVAAAVRKIHDSNKEKVAAEPSWTAATEGVVAGIEFVEADPGVQTVGVYSFPNSEGIIQLDAALIELCSSTAGAAGDIGKETPGEVASTARFGSVMGLEDYPGSIRPAALVMANCDHSYLVGSGAKTFLQQESIRPLLPTPQRLPTYKDVPIGEVAGCKETAPSHDTVGLLALDRTKEGSGGGRVCMTIGCSSSGMKEKHPGRVGDSPIFGSGLYGEAGVGGAVCTGDGDLICTFPLAFLVVQKLKQRQQQQSRDTSSSSASVSDACQMAVNEFLQMPHMQSKIEVGICAMDWEGNVGGASSPAWEGVFDYATASA